MAIIAYDRHSCQLLLSPVKLTRQPEFPTMALINNFRSKQPGAFYRGMASQIDSRRNYRNGKH
jgi:hypothetical protein